MAETISDTSSSLNVSMSHCRSELMRWPYAEANVTSTYTRRSVNKVSFTPDLPLYCTIKRRKRTRQSNARLPPYASILSKQARVYSCISGWNRARLVSV